MTKLYEDLNKKLAELKELNPNSSFILIGVNDEENLLACATSCNLELEKEILLQYLLKLKTNEKPLFYKEKKP